MKALTRLLLMSALAVVVGRRMVGRGHARRGERGPVTAVQAGDARLDREREDGEERCGAGSDGVHEGDHSILCAMRRGSQLLSMVSGCAIHTATGSSRL